MMDQQTKDAIDRIARTGDGQILYRFLQQVVCDVMSHSDDGALREHNGRRRFAADLMTQMGEGIGASGGRHDTVIFKRGGDEQPKRKLSAREWIANQPRWGDELYPDSEPAVGNSTDAA